MSTYPTHTATAKGGRWGEKWVGGWMFFSWRHFLFRLSLRAHLQTLAVWITALGMNHAHIQSLYPQQGHTHPSFHTPTWNTSSTPGGFRTCVCVRGHCPPGEWEGPTSCVKLPLTFHTLPQSAWLDLFFFANSCSFSLSSSLYGGLCQLSEAQNPDSFHELNMILKNPTLFPPHTLSKDSGLARTSFWQWRFTVFEPTHRQMEREGFDEGRRKHSHTHTKWLSMGHNRCLWENWSPM